MTKTFVKATFNLQASPPGHHRQLEARARYGIRQAKSQKESQSPWPGNRHTRHPVRLTTWTSLFRHNDSLSIIHSWRNPHIPEKQMPRIVERGCVPFHLEIFAVVYSFECSTPLASVISLSSISISQQQPVPLLPRSSEVNASNKDSGTGVGLGARFREHEAAPRLPHFSCVSKVM